MREPGLWNKKNFELFVLLCVCVFFFLSFASTKVTEWKMESEKACPVWPTLPGLHESIETEFGHASQYEKELGSGAYGTVRKHTSEKHGTVAVKTTITDDPELTGDVIREVSCLTSMAGHPDIIRLLGWRMPNFAKESMESAHPIYEVQLVLEYGKYGSLSQLLRHHRLTDLQIKSAMYQLLRGTASLHVRDIWHRDIKPGNIIVTEFERGKIDVKLADFGLARAGPFCETTQTEVMYTLWYRPPEILIREFLGRSSDLDYRDYNEKADVWALGIVFWDMLAASRGQTSATVDYLRAKSVRDQLSKLFRAFGWPATREQTPFGWDPRSLRRSMQSRWHPFSENLIPTVRKRKGHPIESVVPFASDTERDLLLGLLRFNDSQRLSTFEALQHPYFDDVRDAPAELAKLVPVMGSATDYCFAHLRTEELRRLNATPITTIQGLDMLPGANVNQKVSNYSAVTSLMLDFLTQTRSDMAVFGLAIDLLHTVLMRPDTIEQPRTQYMLATLGLSCASLAGKYFERHPPSVMSALHTIGATCTPVEMATFEARVFVAVGGDLNLPTAHRMLLDLTGCPANSVTTYQEEAVYAWSVALLFVVLTTRASFSGTRGEQAALAAMIASYYHRVHLAPKQGSGCESSYYPLRDEILQTGVRVVLEDLSRANANTQMLLVDGTVAVLKRLLPPELHGTIPTTMEELATIIAGRRRAPDYGEKPKPKKRLAQILDDEETESESASVRRPSHQHQKKKKTVVLPTPAAAPARPLLSPELSLGMSSYYGT